MYKERTGCLSPSRSRDAETETHHEGMGGTKTDSLSVIAGKLPSPHLSSSIIYDTELHSPERMRRRQYNKHVIILY